MPEVEEHGINDKGKEQWWHVCGVCNKGFWAYKQEYKNCFHCFSSSLFESIPIGRHHTTNSRGISTVYIKLSKDDPYYCMTLKSIGYYGAGWVNEARYLMAKKLGRPLTYNETIKHINGDNTDNRLENLELSKRIFWRKKE